jgi:transposase
MATKVSVITDHQKIPLSISFYPGNQHDASTIESSIELLKLKNKQINLVGDKGYIKNKKFRKKLKRKKITLITPIRCNQKNNYLTVEEKELLKQRSLVEHVFMRLKMIKRVHVRYDRLIDSFRGICYIGLIMKLWN